MNYIEISIFIILVSFVLIPTWCIYKEIKQKTRKKKIQKVNESMLPHKIELANRGYISSSNNMEEMMKYALLHEYTHPRYGEFIKKYKKMVRETN